MKPQRVTIHNNKNEKLVGYLYKGTTKTIIIVCYGLEGTESLDSYLQKILPEYLAAIQEKTGASVYGFDFSGYGESEGENYLCLHKRNDEIKTVIDYFSSRYEKIILYGYSLGAVSCAIAAAKYKEITGLITVNGFFTLSRQTLYWSNISLILMYLLSKPKFGKEIMFLLKELKISQIHVPTLVVYADRDTFVKPEQSVNFFNTLQTKKRKFVLHTNDHAVRKEYVYIPAVIGKWTKEEHLN